MTIHNDDKLIDEIENSIAALTKAEEHLRSTLPDPKVLDRRDAAFPALAKKNASGSNETKMAKLQAMCAQAAQRTVSRGVKNVAMERFEREAAEDIAALVQQGRLSVNDARAMLNLPPLGGSK